MPSSREGRRHRRRCGTRRRRRRPRTRPPCVGSCTNAADDDAARVDCTERRPRGAAVGAGEQPAVRDRGHEAVGRSPDRSPLGTLPPAGPSVAALHVGVVGGAVVAGRSSAVAVVGRRRSSAVVVVVARSSVARSSVVVVGVRARRGRRVVGTVRGGSVKRERGRAGNHGEAACGGSVLYGCNVGGRRSRCRTSSSNDVSNWLSKSVSYRVGAGTSVSYGSVAYVVRGELAARRRTRTPARRRSSPTARAATASTPPPASTLVGRRRRGHARRRVRTHAGLADHRSRSRAAADEDHDEQTRERRADGRHQATSAERRHPSGSVDGPSTGVSIGRSSMAKRVGPVDGEAVGRGHVDRRLDRRARRLGSSRLPRAGRCRRSSLTHRREARPGPEPVGSRHSATPTVPPPSLACGAVDLSGRWRAHASRRRAPPRRHRPRRRRLGVARARRARALAVAIPSSPRATARSSTAAASSWPPPPPGRRRWVTFDGIFYQADVWLDGAYLGDPGGLLLPPQLRHHRAVADSATSTCWPSR